MTNVLIMTGRGGKVIQTTTEDLPLNAQKIIQLSDRETYINRHFRRLIGHGITQNQAAAKYRITQPTISRWRKAGRIKTIGIPADDPTAILVDEADVAYCAEAFHTLGTKPGQKLFNADGSLYTPKEFGELLAGGPVKQPA